VAWSGLIRPPQLQHSETDAGTQRTATWLELFFDLAFLLVVAELAVDGYQDRSLAYQRLVRELLEAQRREIVLMRNQGEIGNEVMHRIERDLDLEDSRSRSRALGSVWSFSWSFPLP
jgi:hypothetical protein